MEPGSTKNREGRVFPFNASPELREMERAGVPRSVAMKHKTESIYRRYAIVSEADLAEAMSRRFRFRLDSIDCAAYLRLCYRKEGIVGKGDHLGEFELLVLLAILRLESNAYGVTIWEEINARTGREAAVGTVYAAVERLLGKGYLSPRIGEATPERGGRAKRFVEITAPGRRALAESDAALQKMRSGMSRKLAWGRS